MESGTPDLDWGDLTLFGGDKMHIVKAISLGPPPMNLAS